jgi:hypothetical protein
MSDSYLAVFLLHLDGQLWAKSILGSQDDLRDSKMPQEHSGLGQLQLELKSKFLNHHLF